MMNRRIRLSMSVALCFGLFAGAAAAAPTIYVDQNATGVDDGTSWTDAYEHLWNATDSAPTAGQINVADGTYYPDRDSQNPIGTDDRNRTFVLGTTVKILGGYAGFGAPNPFLRDPSVFVTILSGDIGTPDDESDNSYHVVTGSSTGNTAVIDGFTIVDGFADNTGGTLPGRGAGMIIENGSPTINNCIFKDNEADISGAGIFSSGGGPKITNSQFTNNFSNAGGGGWHHFAGAGLSLTNGGALSAQVTNCLFSGNTASTACVSRGAALAIWDIEATITGCDFIDNSARTGGALVLGADATGNGDVSVDFTDCLFQGNSATGAGVWWGGAAKIGPNVAVPDTTFLNCRFIENSQSAIWQESVTPPTKFINCLFQGNTGSKGAAILADDDTIITNCTFSDNVAQGNGAAVWWSTTPAAITVRNSVFWGNVDINTPIQQLSPDEVVPPSTSTVEHCLIDDGNIDEDVLFGGGDNNNIDDDPKFVSEMNDNFRLQSGSPALEVGTIDQVDVGDFDLDGNPRIIGTVDMGAYERCDSGSDCDDSDGCTTDICTAGLCSHNFLCSGETPSCVNDVCVCETDAHCDDGNDCTDDVCNGQGACDHANEPAETACEDGLFCTKNDACDAFGTCVGGSSSPCKGNQICCECGIDDGHCIPIGFPCSCP